ncbi:sensor histidine kinase [Psychrobacter aestuarii]|uniref:histidine kinase n=1 Tax=Psychrobacter aestuarii TaxID=556327 RepID=A0ABP3FCA9_9GAMM|nr:ATP-binding protein [Psychrobacter aestuarii]
MKSATSPINDAILGYLQRADTLPRPQLRKLGLIYSSYRVAVSLFFVMMGYVSVKADSNFLLVTLLQQAALLFYVLLSVILFALFLVVTKRPWHQLAFGLGLDVIILSLLLYTNGAPDLQLTMLYMVVVAASFMLLHGTQALIITLLAIILVIYQQFFYAIANSMSLTNLGDALLMSASFLAVGFLSWSVSQRLVHVERMALQHAEEVERLNTINQEVISQMLNGVMVLECGRVVMANTAAYQLLGISDHHEDMPQDAPTNERRWYQKKVITDNLDPLAAFQAQLQEQHDTLYQGFSAVPYGQSRAFVYEPPYSIQETAASKIRVQVIPLKDRSQLILLEDLRREQAQAQQLKLAALGQLTASIAHEIRNPLAAISQASQLLMEDVTELEETETPMGMAMAANFELYEMIFGQTKRVNRIIEDVLKLSKQQPPKQQRIDLSLWLPEFLKNYFTGHDVFLRCKLCPSIQFDTHQLEQVLINLINNGLRYSSYAHPHACVEIETYCQQNDVIIDILDDGAGIRPQDVEQLFHPFFTTDKAGTGLGLYLSQAFCEANHARLLYVTEHEKTCFRLLIPTAGYQVDIHT